MSEYIKPEAVKQCTLLVLIESEFLTWVLLTKNFDIYQKWLWNIESGLNSSTFWVFEPYDTLPRNELLCQLFGGHR